MYKVKIEMYFSLLRHLLPKVFVKREIFDVYHFVNTISHDYN